jgi:hypothetical protein
MASDGRQKPQRGRAFRIPLLSLAAAALALAAFAGPAGAEVVYDNAPTVAAAEVPSLGFEQTGTAELGSLVRLAGAARVDPQIRVDAVVRACGEGTLESGCTTPGATFPLPATLSVYAVGADGAPAQLLARQTQTFELGYEGLLQPLAFSLPGSTLPAEAILSVAFDTRSSGYEPTGVAGPADAVGVALAGPPAAGATPREAEGVYRAASAEAGADPVFAFEAEAALWQNRQPAFTIEAPAPAAPQMAPAPTQPTMTRPFRREVTIPPGKRMTVSFPRASALIAGPGALVQVKCSGASAARCIGTLSLSAAGTVHKAPYSISKGRRQYVVVPLGSDLELLDRLDAPRATATASTVQVGGAAVKTKRALKLK